MKSDWSVSSPNLKGNFKILRIFENISKIRKRVDLSEFDLKLRGYFNVIGTFT